MCVCVCVYVCVRACVRATFCFRHDDVVIAAVTHHSQRSLDERSEESSIRSDVDRSSIVSPMTKLK